MIRCGRCGSALDPGSSSLDFCDATCQALWQAAHPLSHADAVPSRLPLPAPPKPAETRPAALRTLAAPVPVRLPVWLRVWRRLRPPDGGPR